MGAGELLDAAERQAYYHRAGEKVRNEHLRATLGMARPGDRKIARLVSRCCNEPEAGKVPDRPYNTCRHITATCVGGRL